MLLLYLCAGLLSVSKLLLNCRVQSGITEVGIGGILAEQALCSLQATLESLYVLGRRVPAPVGWLVIGAFWQRVSSVVEIRDVSGDVDSNLP